MLGQTKDVMKMERTRSEDYVRHACYLLKTAERDLFSKEGYLISPTGLHKLKTKLYRLGAI